jgi:hypothetical protein
MVYFVFDLDLTLADIDTKLYNNIQLHTNKYAMEEDYFSFVSECAEQEISENPIGFLRPGLVQSLLLPLDFKPYMEQILDLKKKGICQGVIIYSNNGSLNCLHFIRDVIHLILGVNDLICHCIHRTYQGRPRTGDPAKTWNELKTILNNSNNSNNSCAIYNLEPSNVVFFDDRSDHQIRNELDIYDNYIIVDAYHNVRIDKSIIKQYQQTNPNLNDTMFISNYIKMILNYDKNTFQEALDRFVFSNASPTGGRRYNYTLNNKLKQKKQQRKRKYKKYSRKNMKH